MNIFSRWPCPSLLTWEPHVDSLCTRLSRVIYLLRRLKFLVPSAFLKNAYYAFFHGVIVYGIHIWGNCNSISKILVLQKKAVRILTGSVFDAHCKPLFTNEGILTVINLYIYVCLLKIKKNLNNYKTKTNVHKHSTRYNYQLVVPNSRLSITRKWFEISGLNMFNRLPVQSHNVTFCRFKSVIHSFLVLNPFYTIQEFYSNPLNIVF